MFFSYINQKRIFIHYAQIKSKINCFLISFFINHKANPTITSLNKSELKTIQFQKEFWGQSSFVLIIFGRNKSYKLE